MTSRVLDLHSNLPSEALALIKNAEEWGVRELEPCIAEHWEAATFPWSVWESFRNDCPRLLGYALPQRYGGQGYNLQTACHISKTLASLDASFTTALLVQYGLCAESILLCGTEEQKMRLIPPLARLEHMGCFCLTEPQSGSDASDLQTTATKVPGGYVLTGSKRWIGNAMTAEVFIVWAKNTFLPGHPVMGFIVQRSQQTSKEPAATCSIQTTKIEGKISQRMIQNANVEFQNAFCPDANVMSDHGE
jgi:alkylation response protein AidB-like acyl-CoA dehydrogenase